MQEIGLDRIKVQSTKTEVNKPTNKLFGVGSQPVSMRDLTLLKQTEAESQSEYGIAKETAIAGNSIESMSTAGSSLKLRVKRMQKSTDLPSFRTTSLSPRKQVKKNLAMKEQDYTPVMIERWLAHLKNIPLVDLLDLQSGVSVESPLRR